MAEATKGERRKASKKATRRQGEAKRTILMALSACFIALVLGYALGSYAIRVVTGARPQPQSGLATLPLSQPESEASEPAASAPETEPKPAPQARAVALYKVQLGSFATRDAAEALLAQLQAEGTPGFIIAGPPYRVQIGAFSSAARADEAAASFKGKGFEVVIRHEP